MALTTPRWGMQYPELDDTADVPLYIQGLALALDNHAKDDQGALASRPAAGQRGRYFYATDARTLWRDNGTAWDEIPIGTGSMPGDYKVALQTTSHGARAGGLFQWLLADGSEVAASYSELVSLLQAMGSPFGTGPGGRPRLPDLRGRVPVMPDGTAGRMASGDTLGAGGGAQTHTLTKAEMPVHSHGVSDPGHSHAPSLGGGYFITYLESPPGGAGLFYAGGGESRGTSTGTSHNYTGVSIQDAGSGGAHNNMPPYLVLGNWFVKT